MSERYMRGVEIAQQLAADKLDEFLTSRVAELAPDFARMAIEFSLGRSLRAGRRWISAAASWSRSHPWLRSATPARTFGFMFALRSRLGVIQGRDYRDPDANGYLRRISRSA